jgi:hypothetical protein
MLETGGKIGVIECGDREFLVVCVPFDSFTHLDFLWITFLEKISCFRVSYAVASTNNFSYENKFLSILVKK